MRVLVLIAALMVAPGSAHAGRTFYGWLYGSEVMPERGVELQSWITEENFEGGHEENTWLFGAQVGVTDRFELGFPVEIDWYHDANLMPPASTKFARYGIEGRYRFVSADPVDAPAVVPLLRVGLKRMISAPDRHGFQPELDFVLSYESGIVQALIDLGVVAQVRSEGDPTAQIRPGAGVSVLVDEAHDLRVGAEIFAEIPTVGESWFIAGPNASWTHGRFWISGVLGIGLNQSFINTAPRVQWGIAF